MEVYVGVTASVVHPGIINILRCASEYGQVTVGLLTDKALAQQRPLPEMPWLDRKEVIESIEYVSNVVPQDQWSYVQNVIKYKPHVFVHGTDWLEGEDRKIRESVLEALDQYGGKLVEVPYTLRYGSKKLQKISSQIPTSPEYRVNSLQRILQATSFARIIETHSALAGLIAENTVFEEADGSLSGFHGFWSSSLSDSALLGKPDTEYVSIPERLESINHLFDNTTKPMIMDIDTGGKVQHLSSTLRRIERTGVSAVVIEDKTGFKQNSLFGTSVPQELEDIKSFCEKIEACNSAKLSPSFMTISRIEALIAGAGMDEALKRAHAYVEAGTDGIMIHSRHKDGLEIKQFSEIFKNTHPEIPLVMVPTSYNTFTEDELMAWGANIIIYANHLLRASYPAMEQAAKSILQFKRSKEIDSSLMPIKQVINFIPN